MGCTHAIDLSAVQQYAKVTAAASAGFDAVANGYYETCMRAREYAQPAGVAGQPLSATPPPRPLPSLTPKPGETPHPLNPQATDPNCFDASAIAYRWQDENHVVVDYVRSLGAVAGVDTTPSDFNTLASSLKAAGAIESDATATAAGNLAAALAGALIAARQRAALREIVQAAQDNGLPVLVTGLQSVADLYVGKLNRERTTTGSYYDTVLGGEEREFAVLECASTSNHEIRAQLDCRRYPAVVKSGASVAARIRTAASAARLRDLMRRQRVERLDDFGAIDQHVAAARAYRDAIGTIGEGNAALLKTPPNDVQAIADAVKPYVSSLEGEVAALVAALRK